MALTDLMQQERARARQDAAPERKPTGRSKATRFATHAVTVLAVIAATLLGAYIAIATYGETRELSVGQIELNVDPGHKGALDLYVPLVDWGARFEAVRLPVRISVDLRTVDRTTVERVAEGGSLDVQAVRAEARDAIAGYLKALIGFVLAVASGLGLLTAFAIRHRAGPRLRYTTATAIATTLALGVALIVLLPPRGEITEPQYYAHGPDIPRALDALEAAQRSRQVLEQELNAQLVGLARLITAPGNRPVLDDRPRITLASDLHNNILSVPILERTADRGPVFFAGDLTDRGSPIEAALVRRVIRTGRPFVFVPGNHDSDQLTRRLARDGAIVLTRTGRLGRNGDTTTGRPIITVAGLRIAGYDDPFQRRSGEGFADRYDRTPDASELERFANWLRPIRDDLDAVIVHNPALLGDALAELAEAPRPEPLLILTGHTHEGELIRGPNQTIVNAGTVGAGGTTNLLEREKIGIARVSYESAPAFRALAADLVTIDPRSGSATARRERLDEPPPPEPG
jgi:predicted phosphodiesterase